MGKSNELESCFEAEELETLRRRIEELENEIGEIGNQAERSPQVLPGSPEDDQTVRCRLEKLHFEKKEKTELLEGKVREYSLNNSGIIDRWLYPHEYRCRCIIREGTELGVDKDDAQNRSIREDIAKDILKEVKKIKGGKGFYFSINPYYLKDYYLNLIIDSLPGQDPDDRDDSFEKFIGSWVGIKDDEPYMQFQVIDGTPHGQIYGREIKNAIVEGNYLKFYYEYLDFSKDLYTVDVEMVLSKDRTILAGITILRDNVKIKCYPFFKRK